MPVVPGYSDYCLTAAIIASQGVEWSLIGESIHMDLWPKMKIKYPQKAASVIGIGSANLLLFVGCCGIVLYFKNSTNMAAAYGPAITMHDKYVDTLSPASSGFGKGDTIWIYLYPAVWMTIEISFVAPTSKSSLMVVCNINRWRWAVLPLCMCGTTSHLKNRYVEFIAARTCYIPHDPGAGNDKSVTKYSTHLVHDGANNPKEIEHRSFYSILNKNQSAPTSIGLCVDTVDDPYTCEYVVDHIIPNDIHSRWTSPVSGVQQKINHVPAR